MFVMKQRMFQLPDPLGDLFREHHVDTLDIVRSSKASSKCKTDDTHVHNVGSVQRSKKHSPDKSRKKLE
jgi:hypothetical protein